MKTFKDTLIETFKRNMGEATRKGGPRVCLCVILTNGDEHYGLAKEITNDSFVLDIGDDGDKKPVTLTVPMEKLKNIIEWCHGQFPEDYK
ncbi:MAG: hypothetical protein KBC33_01955 [Candidatus Pacebacteria bacterium]|nr:hypothetical protein [Candidatus Paceibacterota bacterium]